MTHGRRLWHGWNADKKNALPRARRLGDRAARRRTHALARFFSPLLAMSAARGALTTLRAATDPHAPSGSYWGPSGLGELRGHPVPARISERALDSNVARELWEQSEALTGVSFRPAPAA